MATPVHYWLRHEIKPFEQRTPLLPENAKALLDAGFKVTVEKSPTRCRTDAEYAAVGCTLVEKETWPQAPSDAVILGLKELPENDEPLKHNHVFFAHCYKGT
jgi:saccharopine dehydrogenase (NAD+, L-lysine-forming)